MDAMNQHKQMAMGKGLVSGVSGVSSTLGGVGMKQHMDRDHKPSHMPDAKRGARPPLAGGGSRMANQANPDHGPHCC